MLNIKKIFAISVIKYSLYNSLKDISFGANIVNFNAPYANKGLGFCHKGVEYIHHSTLPFHETVFHRFTNTQKLILFFLLLIFSVFFISNFAVFFLFLTTILSLIYFIDIFFNLSIIRNGIITQPEIRVSIDELKELKDSNLPIYTILCPLYKEAKVIPQFIKAIQNMDYPKDKLQVIIILEDNDSETINAAKNVDLLSNFKVVIMPDTLPKTKPKALNYGIKFATGKYVVVYDAEDVPELNQLKKVVIAFSKTNEKTICIQAKLNFYNQEQNILTRLFTGEYALLFGLLLPGLQSVNAPIPLGGTSNHFVTEALKSLNKWDSFNVTEDCDLGIRLFKKGFLTAIVDSTTYEEANSQIRNWINQRIRWQKGYMLSYFVHLRRPSEFFKNNYKIHFFTFHMILGAKIFTVLINPIMWFIMITYFFFKYVFNINLEGLYLEQISIITILNLILGYAFYFTYYIVALIKINKKSIIPYIILLPIYWIMMSLTAYIAIYEAYKRPHVWSKTEHGLHLNNKQNKQNKAKFIGSANLAS